jgi:cytochrome c556
MTRFPILTALSLTGALIAGAALAQTDPLTAAVAARQAHMDLYAFNIGQLGAMAQGAIPYDAAMAQGAADNLVALSALNQMAYWLPGTEAGVHPESRAKAEMWANIDDAIAKGQALNAAAVAMQGVAGTGLEPLQAAMGALGGACGACHEAYRQSQ